MGDATTPPGTDDRERRIQTVCLLILTAVAIGTALYLLRPVLIPFVLAVFLVYCLTPAIDLQVNKWRVPRPLAVVSTIVLGCVLLSLMWLLVGASVSQMTANAAVYEEKFGNLITSATKFLAGQGIDTTQLLGMLKDTAGGLATGLISGIMSVLSNGLLVVIFMIFILAGKSSPAAASGSFREQVERGIKQYILTKVVVSATTGILVGLTLQLLGVELAMVFGLLALVSPLG